MKPPIEVTDEMQKLVTYLRTNPDASEWQTGDEFRIRNRTYGTSGRVTTAAAVIALLKIAAQHLAEPAMASPAITLSDDAMTALDFLSRWPDAVGDDTVHFFAGNAKHFSIPPSTVTELLRFACGAAAATPAPDDGMVKVPAEVWEKAKGLLAALTEPAVSVARYSNAIRIECGSFGSGGRVFGIIDEALEAFRDAFAARASPEPSDPAADLAATLRAVRTSLEDAPILCRIEINEALARYDSIQARTEGN